MKFIDFVLFISVFYSPTVLGKAKVEVLFTPKDWTSQQEQLIRNAANIVYELMPSFKINQCALKYSSKGQPDARTWETKIADLRRARNIKIKIIKGVTRDSALGQAKVGGATVVGRDREFAGLEIRLNDSHVNYAYLDKKMNRHPDPSQQRYEKEAFWAEIIAHELAHNLGLDHGNTADWEKSYKGYFITELGACVKSGGKMGSYDLLSNRVKK